MPRHAPTGFRYRAARWRNSARPAELAIECPVLCQNLVQGPDLLLTLSACAYPSVYRLVTPGPRWPCTSTLWGAGADCGGLAGTLAGLAHRPGQLDAAWLHRACSPLPGAISGGGAGVRDGTAAPPGGQFQQRGLDDQPVPRRGASAGRSQPIAVKSGLISKAACLAARGSLPGDHRDRPWLGSPVRARRLLMNASRSALRASWSLA